MKKICLFISIALLLSFQIPTFASTVTDNNLEITNAVKNVVNREYGVLDIAPDDAWIPLEDVSGTEYAYFIPLINGMSIEGYSVVSFINGENRVLKTACGELSADLAQSVVDVAGADETNRIIYDFPDAFLVECEGEYYKVCVTGALNNVEPSDYTNMSASRLSSVSAFGNGIQPREEITYGSLDDTAIGHFIPIPNGSTYYYGGYQGWLTDKGVSTFYANRSCGVTAAANAMYYMATHISGKSQLYNQTGLTKAKFNTFQKAVYDYLNPSFIGVPTLNDMIDGVVDYANSRGVTLTPMSSPSNWTYNNVLNYMKTGLNSESPVLVLNWNSPIEDLVMHWVTVTKIYGDNVSTYMVTSNWGEYAIYDFNIWVNGSSVYKGTTYFV